MKVDQESYIGNRYEFKYVLKPELAYRVQNYIEKMGLEMDQNSKNGSYIVNSLYFETPFLDDYYDKDASLLVRKKVRARMYDESWEGYNGNVWLEIKNKRNFQILKERARISSSDWASFSESQNPIPLMYDCSNESDKSFLNKFSYFFLKGRYRPHIVVRYKRMAYLDNFTSKIRVTFDSGIHSRFFEDGCGDEFMTPVFTEYIIMEVKFNDKLPWWFTRVMKTFDIKRTDFSKYNHSVASLRNSYRIPVSR